MLMVIFMTKIWIGTLVSLILLIICWFGFNIDDFEMVRFMTTVYSSILFVCFLFTGVVKQIRKKASPYCIFAVVNFLIGISISIFSIYDIKTNVDEWFGGLLGTILLVFVIPFIILLLIIDFVVWKKSKLK